MLKTKGLSDVSFLLGLGLFVASCGGAVLPPRTPETAKAEFAKIDVPQTVESRDRNQYLPTILELPDEHPQRTELRDALVRSYAAEFDSTEENDTQERMKLFQGAMSVHVSRDFAPERVSTFAVPMARWVAKHMAKQGNEAAVLASLRFLMLAEPSNVEHKERYFELTEWSETARRAMSPIERSMSLVQLYRQALALVPDRDMATKLAQQYVTRHKDLTSLFRDRDRGRFDLSSLPDDDLLAQVLLTPALVIHAMFLVGDPAGARRFLEPLVGNYVEDTYLSLLDKIFQRIEIASAYYDLARVLERVDRSAALRAAFLARAEDPRSALYSLYIGQTFDILQLPECSTDFYAEVVRLAPDDEELLANAVELSRRAMLAVHFAEKNERARYAVEVGDRLVEQIRPMLAKVEDKSPLPLIVAHFLYSMGDVEFDDGLIDDALRHYQASHEILPDSRALLRISEVRFLRGETKQALSLVQQAAAKLKQDKSNSRYFEATLEERRGEILSALGRAQEAKQSWSKALEIWRSVERVSEHAAMAAMRRGVLLDKLGDTSESSQQFRLAIRLDPDNRGTYAEILSFLVVRGRLDDAQSFYRLAYNQDRIEPTWKIYYSLWVEGLAMRKPPKGGFELARAYLEQSEGKSWQDHLAAYFVGKLTIDELRSKAVNKGQNVEVDYYSALLDLAAGNTEKARAKLQSVLDSNLMGFFEYRMARGILIDELPSL
jgi:tetratricopeptide (TPR) repeat protein